MQQDQEAGGMGFEYTYACFFDPTDALPCVEGQKEWRSRVQPVKYGFPLAWVKGVSDSIPIRCLRLGVHVSTESKNISDVQGQKLVCGKFFQILNLICLKDTMKISPDLTTILTVSMTIPVITSGTEEAFLKYQ